MTDRNAKQPTVDATSSSKTSAPDRQAGCRDIVEPSIGRKRSGAAENAGQSDDDQQWLATVLTSLKTRSNEVREALKMALENGEDNASSLLGLEPVSIENKQQNADQIEDSNLCASRNPLLGTTLFQ